MNHWEYWGWSQRKPFLGDLLKFNNQDHLFVFRDDLINKLYDSIRLSIETCSDGIFLLAGMPGVGKSTLLKYLIQKKFTKYGKRISLINTSGDALSGNTQITSFQLLDILVQLNSQLNYILTDATNQQEPDNFERVYKRYLEKKYGSYTDSLIVHSEDFEVIQDLVTSEILPKAKAIQALHGKIPLSIVAIDDVDYLSPDSQIKILSLLCMISQETINPKILYTARPVAADIATHSVATRLNHSIDRSILVESIDPCKIIHARMTDCDKEGLINPFGEDGVENFIRKITNGNIRTAISLVKKATTDGGEYISKDNPLFRKSCLLRVLFGKKVESKDDLSKDTERPGYIPNIFGNQFEESRIPLVYVMLLTIHRIGIVYINESFTDKFNQTCSSINLKLSENKTYGISLVEEVLWYCHKGHLLRRTGFNNIADYITYRSTHKQGIRNSLMYTKVELTDRGKKCLAMSKQEEYQQLTGLRFYSRVVQDNIKNMTWSRDL